MLQAVFNRFGLGLSLLALVACGAPPPPPAPTPLPPATLSAPERITDGSALAQQFENVVARMKPLSERICRERTQFNCDYQIVIDDRPNAPINAFHTLSPSGQPIIGFTLALIADARNEDELAFVFGHEVAHHLAGHIPRSQNNAILGAMILGSLAAATGAAPGAIRSAQNLGATVGVRSYSKAFELEADRLGAMLAYRAGYDPLRGAQFFERIPDPGNQFLGTHPPNAERKAVVRQTVAELRAGRAI